MQYDSFVEGVQHRLVGSSREEAERSVNAVLLTLAESLDREGRRMLSAHLPDRLLECISDKAVSAEYGPEEFLSRISQRAKTGDREPREIVRAVLELLQQSLPPGEVVRMLDHLPAGLRNIGGRRMEEGRSPETHVRSI